MEGCLNSPSKWYLLLLFCFFQFSVIIVDSETYNLAEHWMTHQPALSILSLHSFHGKKTELPGNRAYQRNVSHFDGRPAVHLEAKPLEKQPPRSGA